MVELGIGGLGPATEIGVGASSIVYRARQVDLDREVAIKVLSVTDEAFVRRFDREAKTLGKLSQNPAIVTVYDTGVNGSGQPYLILELCESSVLDHLKGPGKYEPEEACRLASQVADAVADAHTNGIAHRDIKPGNILISATGRAMVADFGISTVTGGSHSQTNSVGFTAGYVAPETLNGGTAGTAADVYAVGATLFHMVAGHAPFVDESENANLLALAQRVIKEPVPDLRPDGVPDEICRIIEGAMAKLPQDRPTAAQLRDQLKAVVKDLDSRPTVDDFDNLVSESADDALTTVASGAAAGAAGGLLAAGAETAMGATAAESAPTVSTGGPPAGPTANNRPSRSIFDLPSDPGVVDGVAPPPPGGGPSATAARPTGRPSQEVTRSLPDESVLFPGRDLRTTSSAKVLGGPGESFDPPKPPTATPARYTADDGRPPMAALIGAGVVGLLILLGLGAFAISQIGGDDEGDQALDTVEGPTLSSEEGESLGSENESGTGDEDGSRGTLSPTTETTTSTSSSSTSSSTSTTIKTVNLPSLVGSTEAQARTRLTALGLLVNVVGRESDQAEGTVLSQDPASGASVDEGSTITITVAKARPIPTVVVPDLSGKTQAQAETDLGAIDLSVAAAVTRQFSDTVAKDLIISTSPPAGTTVNINTAISIVLSDGFEPACPGIEGKTRAAAVSELEGKGRTVTIRDAFSSAVAKDLVISCGESDDAATLTVSFGPNPCTGAVGKQRSVVVADLEAAGITVTKTGLTRDSGILNAVTSCTATTSTATVEYIETLEVKVAVPDVVGGTVAAARTAITDRGLTVGDVTDAFSDTVPAGQVISSSPAAGVEVDEGSAVNLVVSKGPEATLVEVPRVVGARQAVAQNRITQAGLTVGDVTTASSETVEAGRVISSDPAEGTEVAEGSAVNLVVSTGPDTPPTVDVPTLVGLTQAEAEAALSAANLVAAVEFVDVTDEDEDGVVQSSDPIAGTEVAEGSTVTIKVGQLVVEDGEAQGLA
jgi:beta-lactam-binding protein with PASTA domain/serine/threonine protein kinase